MAIEVKLPELGDGIESGDVLEVFVSVGDVITEGQDIIEMETDKATVPVPSSVAGKVVKINVGEGDSVPIGGVLLEVESEEGAEEQSPADSGGEPEAKAEAASEDRPAEAARASGDPPAKAAAEAEPAEREPAEQPEPEAEATPAEEPTPASRSVASEESAGPEKVPPASADERPSPASAAASPPPAAKASEASPGGKPIAAGPAIRRFAREVGVDLGAVRGSGEGGRITREDVLAVVRSASQAARSGNGAGATASTPSAGPQRSAAAPDHPPRTSLPGTADRDDYGPIRVERMSKIRKTIAAQMHASWSGVPRVTNFDDADITDLEQLRQSSKEDYAAQGLKLTTMPFLIKAVATALRHHPAINAIIDQENEQVIYKDYVNVGIAVDTDRGLVVPVMRDADRMGIPDIARGLSEMSAKVRGGQFAVSDLRGGTFTISNLGAIGGQYSTPIVNIPEVAILLVGRSRKLPVVMPDDSIRPRLMMPLSLSYDHRLVDGATAARFLNDIIGYLQAPSRLLLAL